jgi:alpha-mannosidase
VQLSSRTGGIQSVTFHGQRGNRVSQQTNFRYERELNIPPSPGEEPRKTHFANSKLISHQILRNGPVFAAVETITEFHSPGDGSILGQARQITSIDRLRPVLEFEIELTIQAQPVRGNPWLTGWCCRFAWDNESATISRSILGQTGSFRLERIESPDYVEIADGPKRLTIIADGRPWHRRSGNRMLDSILVVENEDSRRFRFRLDFDQPCPLRSAEEMLSSVIEFQSPHTKPANPSAWILGLSARNVQLVQSRWHALAPNEPDQLDLILSETDGLSAECMIRTARKPSAAYTVNHDLSHKILLPSSPAGEPVLNLQPFQLQHVLLIF